MLLAEVAENISNSPIKSDKSQKAFSCLRCFERKVKCDKNHPCGNCVKSNVDCHFRVPSAPKRKKKRGPEEILLERLKRAEDLLKAKGIDTTQPNESKPPDRESSHSQASAEVARASSQKQDHVEPTKFLNNAFTTGKLIQDEGRARFVDNNLWSTLSEEIQSKEAIDEYSDDNESEADESNEFILGLTPISNATQHLHPTTDAIFKLWQVFLDNVNPMTKIIHYPSLQEQLVKASVDLEKIPRGLEALMFAIYHAAVTSLDETECEKLLGETRKSLLSRYRHGTRRALAKARFLGTADLAVLQAFTLYVLMIRPESDARTVWTLAGVANRIAQSMGVHRDGRKLGVPPFETELRRRLWWQITILDFRSAELTGSGRFGDISLSDTEVPTNVNDSDIWPGMKEWPVGTHRPTEMMACLLRCEFGRFWKEKLTQKMQENPNQDLHIHLSFSAANTTSQPSLEERDKHIEELNQRLEEKFVRYCEPQIPLQFITSLIARGAITSMMMMAHHPRRYKDESQIPESERRLLWQLSMKMLESDSLAISTKAIKRFQWHTKVYFQWQALIFILSQLKVRTTGEEVDAAWTQIDELYDNHPEFVIEWRKPLHVAVGGLCLKAWDARVQGRLEAQSMGEYMLPLRTPDYIEMLRQQRSMPKHRSDRQASSSSKISSPPQKSTPGTRSFVSQTSTSSQVPTPSHTDLPSNASTSMQWEPSHIHPTSSPDNFNFNPAGLATNPLPQFYFDPGMSYGFDQNLTQHGGGGTNEGGMNWNQWDSLLQDFELGGNNPRFAGARMYQ